MNVERFKTRSCFVFCSTALATVFAYPGNCQPTGTTVDQLNTSASTSSSSEAGSEASWTEGFPIAGFGTSVLTPSGVYYMPTSLPNPAYKVKQDQAIQKAEAHEVKALVRNYSWPVSDKRKLSARSSPTAQ